MSHGTPGRAGAGATRRSGAATWVSNGLALGASPTFALMALLTGAEGHDHAQMLCSAAAQSPLSGMAAMYLLMSLFHLSPWLRWVRQRGEN